MTKELIDANAATGLQIFHEYSEADDTSVYHYRAHGASQVLDRNRAEAADATGPMGDMVKVASIPVGVIYEWIAKYGVNLYRKDHADGVKRLLNDPDYRWLKCRNIII